MDRADIVGMTDALREAFLAAGKDIEEKRTVTGHAFFVGGRAVGQFDRRASALRVRLWLGDKERRVFEARPTFDADSGWLHVVSDDDVAFVRSLMAAAYRAASSRAAGATPPVPRPPAASAAPPSAWTVEAAAPERKRLVTPAPGEKGEGEKKKGAVRRPASRT